MYNKYNLVLVVTENCNMRCDYCYVRDKSSRVMPADIARKAIDRAVDSIKAGGVLELGFFGGEPLLESERIGKYIDYARQVTKGKGLQLVLFLTTNGTIDNEQAWQIMLRDDMSLTISLDGRAETHDKHRRFCDGKPSSEKVLKTIEKLQNQGHEFGVIAVAGPDNVGELDMEVNYLYNLGIQRIDLSLNLWNTWGTDAAEQLHRTVAKCARIWKDGLPERKLSWFDDKLASLMDRDVNLFRCGFGKGQIAVSVEGHLYPCERLVGNNNDNKSTRMPGDVFDGDDFWFGPKENIRTCGACQQCGIADVCNTTCGCCNFVRSGDAGVPDNLLCQFNKWCLEETQKILSDIMLPDETNQEL